jgi:CRP/FNR family transcriptional regulator, cyclic AMP receptor protein
MNSTSSTYIKAIEKLFDGSRSKFYSKNQLIHYQGDPLNQIYLVKKGYVKAYTILDSGDTRTILILAKGDVFPLAFSTTMNWEEYKIRYFYQSLTDTELQVMPSQSLRDYIESDLKYMNIYLSYLAASNEAIMNQLEVMKNKKAIDKVAMLLPYLISKCGRRVRPGTYELQLKLSHQEIADLSGVTRETTTTLIKQLEKDKIIDQKHGKWIVYTKNLK